MKAAALAALALLAGTAGAVDVYKWKDGNGGVHYGDRPPPGTASSTLDVPDDALSPEEEAAARERLDRARAKLAEPAPVDAPLPVVRRPAAKKPASYDCEQAWRHYEASQSCYLNHRAANGKGVSPAGLALCRPMPQPTCER
jgi:hypothetical protein